MMSTDKEIRALRQHIRSYLDWIDSLPYRNSDIKHRYNVVLMDFLGFVRNKEMANRGDHAFQIPTYFNDGKTDQPLKPPEEGHLCPRSMNNTCSIKNRACRFVAITADR